MSRGAGDHGQWVVAKAEHGAFKPKFKFKVRVGIQVQYESGPGLGPISPGSCKLIHVDL